ncbi:MAG: hypothetical protein P8182_07740, partial [Deltaproteobacteria bacterium]
GMSVFLLGYRIEPKSRYLWSAAGTERFQAPTRVPRIEVPLEARQLRKSGWLNAPLPVRHR